MLISQPILKDLASHHTNICHIWYKVALYTLVKLAHLPINDNLRSRAERISFDENALLAIWPFCHLIIKNEQAKNLTPLTGNSFSSHLSHGVGKKLRTNPAGALLL